MKRRDLHRAAWTVGRADTGIMTPQQASQYLKLHIVTLYRLLKKGQVPGAKIGGQWRFEKAVLDDWLIARIRKGLR